MSVSQCHARAFYLPQFTIIFTIAIVLLPRLVSTASALPLDNGNLQSLALGYQNVSGFAENSLITPRGVLAETVEALAKRMSQGKMKLPIVSPEDQNVEFVYRDKDKPSTQRRSRIEPKEIKSEVAESVKFKTAKIYRKGAITSQGAALWNPDFSESSGNLLYKLYDNSPGSKFIYDAFTLFRARKNDDDLYQLLMPIPKTTLKVLLSRGEGSKNELLVHLLDVFQGVKHMYEHEVATPDISPHGVFVSKKKDEITLLQWGDFNTLIYADEEITTAFVHEDSGYYWLAPEQYRLVMQRQRNSHSRQFPYNVQLAGVFNAALMGLAVLTISGNKFDAQTFQKLQKELQKNPYQSTGDPQSTLGVLERYFAEGRPFGNVPLYQETAHVFSNLLCAEGYRKGIDYLIYEWPELAEVQNADDSLPDYECLEN